MIRSLRTDLLIALVLAVAAAACARERSFDVRGRIAGFGDDPHTVIVEHEAIPGYMAAMTMPFEAVDSTALRDLEVGDAIAFTLVVGDEAAWIDDLVLLPDDALPEHPAGRPDAFAAGGNDLLDRGDAVPESELITHADSTLRLSELRGRRVLLTFIYTTCPIPDFCPLMSRNFARLQPELAAIDGPPVHLLSVSFDPERDTPDVLRAYADRYTSDLSSWTFATGDSAAIQQLAGRLGVFYRTDAEQIIHNLVTVLVDENGIIRRIWRGNDWTPDDVLEALNRNAGGA